MTRPNMTRPNIDTYNRIMRLSWIADERDTWSRTVPMVDEDVVICVKLARNPRDSRYVIVEQGCLTDGGSVPRLVRALVSPFDSEFLPGWVAHDRAVRQFRRNGKTGQELGELWLVNGHGVRVEPITSWEKAAAVMRDIHRMHVTGGWRRRLVRVLVYWGVRAWAPIRKIASKFGHSGKVMM